MWINSITWWWSHSQCICFNSWTILFEIKKTLQYLFHRTTSCDPVVWRYHARHVCCWLRIELFVNELLYAIFSIMDFTMKIQYIFIQHQWNENKIDEYHLFIKRKSNDLQTEYLVEFEMKIFYLIFVFGIILLEVSLWNVGKVLSLCICDNFIYSFSRRCKERMVEFFAIDIYGLLMLTVCRLQEKIVLQSLSKIEYKDSLPFK